MQGKSSKKVLTSFGWKQKCRQVKLFKSWDETFMLRKKAFLNEGSCVVKQKKNHFLATLVALRFTPAASKAVGRRIELA